MGKPNSRIPDTALWFQNWESFRRRDKRWPKRMRGAVGMTIRDVVRRRLLKVWAFVRFGNHYAFHVGRVGAEQGSRPAEPFTISPYLCEPSEFEKEKP